MYKKILDVIAGLAGFFIFVLLYPVIGLAIKLDSPGPILFKQTRVGMHNREFILYKFRSMRVTAEDEKAEEEDDDFIAEPGSEKKEDKKKPDYSTDKKLLEIDETAVVEDAKKDDKEKENGDDDDTTNNADGDNKDDDKAASEEDEDRLPKGSHRDRPETETGGDSPEISIERLADMQRQQLKGARAARDRPGVGNPRHHRGSRECAPATHGSLQGLPLRRPSHRGPSPFRRHRRKRDRWLSLGHARSRLDRGRGLPGGPADHPARTFLGGRRGAEGIRNLQPHGAG